MEEQESKDVQYERVFDKLHHKMPVTFRFGLLGGFLLGCSHAMLASKKYYIYTHTVGLGLAAGLGLCYNDFGKLWSIYQSK